MKNKLFLVISFVFGMLLAAPNSFAGQVESTTIESIQVNSNDFSTTILRDNTFYQFADSLTDKPACATDPLERMIVRSGNAASLSARTGGGELKEALTDAFNNQTLIDVIGSGECQFGFETIQYIIAKQP